MPHQSVAQIRLNNIATYLTITANTVQVLADSLKTPLLGAIVNTVHAILKNIEVSFCMNFFLRPILSGLLDSSTKQSRLCPFVRTDPQIAQWNCRPSYQVKCWWRNASPYTALYWKAHTVLLILWSSMISDCLYQDIAQDSYFCRGSAAERQQSEKILPPGRDQCIAQTVQSRIAAMLRVISGILSPWLANKWVKNVVCRLRQPMFYQTLQTCKEIHKRSMKK